MLRAIIQAVVIVSVALVITSCGNGMSTLYDEKNQNLLLFMNPAGGVYSEDTSVSIICSIDGAVVRYTTDGSDPDDTSPVYTSSSPIPIAGDGTSMTIKAFATAPGKPAAAISEDYTIDYATVSTPSMSKPGGTYNEDQSIVITCSTPGATIYYSTYYTTSGVTVPDIISAEYTGAISVAGDGTNMTIEATAIKLGMKDSTIRTETYIIDSKVSTPVMDPAGGTFVGSTSVTIDCDTIDAIVYYTIDGSDPTEITNLSRISTSAPSAPIPVTVEGIVVLKAYAVKAGMGDSDVAEESYTITSLPPVPGNSGTLTFSEVKNNSVRVHWDKATDDKTAQQDLQYLVYYSSSSNIDTVANIEANGVAVDLYEANLGQKQVLGLLENTAYYFNVIVKDQGGNKSAYIMNSCITLTVPLNISGSGTATTLTTTPTITFPMGITSVGNYLYLTTWTSNLIVRVNKTNGTSTTIAGSGVAGSLDGTGTAAQFKQPSGICTDGTNLYVCDTSNNLIRKIVISTGIVTTLANSIESYGITTDGTNLYVTNYSGHRIEKIVISSGAKTIYAGSGADGTLDGIGTAAQFGSLWGICTDGTYLYVADCYTFTGTSGNRLRKIKISTAEVTTIATNVGFPRGVTTDGVYVYICASGNGYVKKISVNGGALSNLTAITSPNYITIDGVKLYVTDESDPKEITTIE